ncbi:hypothetical protein Lal_00030972 [Lupinus albus]|nr:hypothetical protein Lal_00030972 [Lupinus albus]
MLKSLKDSTTSLPFGSSKMYGLVTGSGSLINTIGDLGLFLEPGGRPLGLRATSIVAPSETGFWAVNGVGPPLLWLSSSSEIENDIVVVDDEEASRTCQMKFEEDNGKEEKR